tara:strand:+ start:7419 stop:7919 length:501 start_codon:yes stop_codon:yes gene_type:complete
MANFPSLIPSSRLYINGDFPNVLNTSLSGVVRGFRRGNRRIQQTLQLTFTNLNETEVNQIRSHYDGQNGSFEIFFLTSSIWNDYATPPVPLVSDFAWLYSQPPIIKDSITNKWDVEVELQTIPIDRGELIYDAGDSGNSIRTNTLDALDSSATPVRTNIIDAGDSF